MLPNEITLQVDPANDETLVSETYRRFREISPDRTIYAKVGTTQAARDEITFSRTLPKRSGTFAGVSRPGVKLLQDTTVSSLNGEDTKAQLIADLSMSIPVGTDPTVVKAFKQRLAAVLLDDDTVMDDILGGFAI